MKNNITIFEIFQKFLSKEEITEVYESFNYNEKSRKFKIFDLYNFFISSTINEYKSYKYGADMMAIHGIRKVD